MGPDLSTYQRASGWLGRSLRYYASIGSTNDAALAAAAAGVSEGLVVVADVQHSGRGRLNRRWESPPGSGLLLSILFRPPEPFVHHAGRATMICGLAMQTAVEAVCGLRTKLKWPNDLIYESGDPGSGWVKLAGMLSEIWTSPAGDTGALVVGLGINVNMAARRLAEVSAHAGSLSALVGTSVSRVALLEALLEDIEARYDTLCAGDDPLARWRDQLAWLGRSVDVLRGPTHLCGTMEGVDDDGNLLLRTEERELLALSAGDVSLRLL
ncbi:MAG: biotin--[acetyl-CoA-carboxylase] ligase [Anaerolineae bacterium]|nr:biotin--[acetyl-CoA-carboxylase] ligase [Anaerolineae bacterium]